MTEVHVLTISAPSEEALTALTAAYAKHLDTSDQSPRDICHTSNVGRRHFEHRRAVAGRSREELARKLSEGSRRQRPSKRPAIAFVFPGQGSGIASQSALCEFEVALAEKWMSYGIVPDAVLGHSVGEYAAAVIAGVFSYEDGLRLIRERERLMNALPERGAMAAVFADRERVLSAIRETGLSIAAFNGSHVVISGAAEEVRVVSEALRTSGVNVRPLAVANAFHSRLMDPMLAPFESVVSQVSLRRPSITYVSAVTGEVAGAELSDPLYWLHHIRQPVRFDDAVRRLDCSVVIEIGPGATLLNIARHSLHGRPVELLPGHEVEETLAALYELGFDVDWPAASGGGRKVPLPLYPFQRKRYWVAKRSRGERRSSARIAVPFSDDAHYEWLIRGDSLADHAFNGSVVVPAATYIALALESVDGTRALRDVVFPHSLSMAVEESRTLRLIAGPSKFRFVSLRDDAQPHSDSSWVTHCSGAFDDASHSAEAVDLDAIRARLGDEHAPSAAGDAGFAIGASFRWTKSVREGESEVLCRMEMPDALHAGFLDACLRTLALCIKGGGTYVPARIASLRTFGGAGTWCHARATEIAEGRIVGDVRLVDDAGNVVVEVIGLDARRIAAAKDDSLLEIVWQPIEPRAKRGARWLATTPELAASLREHGEVVVDDYPTDILTDATDGESLLDLARSEPAARVWVIARGPSQAWASGLGKVVNVESPRARWTTVDADDDLAPFFVQCTGTSETEIAIRGGACLVPRLARKTIAPREGASFRADASYLVTGAFGAIGRQLARWMVDEGARHLVLAGRNPAPVELAANVLTVAADVADAGAVARLFEEAAASMPPIRGIFHAAGTLDDALLPDLTWDRFERVLRPKIDGTRNLHHHSLGLELDHFVCFSSAASMIGSRGQASYAAANAFMDALIHERRRLGYPGLSINWSAWAGEGMGRDFSLTGFTPIPPAEALELLGRLLRTDVAQVGVIPADWPKVLSTLFDELPPLFSNLVDHTEARDRLLPALERTPTPVRRRKLEEHLRGLIVSTMGRDPFPSPENDLSFFELGMDSLMSLALRNRLQSDLDRTIPSTVALEYPTIPELADYLIRSVLPAEMFGE